MFLLRRIRPALGKEREVDTLAEEKRILYNSCYVVVNYSDVMVSVCVRRHGGEFASIQMYIYIFSLSLANCLRRHGGQREEHC